jgi:hypothetical protein
MKLLTPPKVYPPIGRCIYCGGVNDDLRREHIVPFGLAGNLILPKASCRACEAITGSIERACLRGMLGNFRIRQGFPTRRKKERPSSLSMEILGANGKVTNQNVPVKEFPRLLYICRQPPAGILVGRAPSNEWIPDPCIIVHGADAEKAFGKSWNFGQYRHSDLCLMLAKIAHSYAVAELGLAELEKYNLPLRKLILEKAASTGHYVGGQPTKDPPAEPGLLHKLQIERGDLHGIQFVLVHIRLFAHLGAPQYHVVVGERPLNAV